jgi:hypothetical protein
MHRTARRSEIGNKPSKLMQGELDRGVFMHANLTGQIRIIIRVNL